MIKISPFFYDMFPSNGSLRELSHGFQNIILDNTVKGYIGRFLWKSRCKNRYQIPVGEHIHLLPMKPLVANPPIGGIQHWKP